MDTKFGIYIEIGPNLQKLIIDTVNARGSGDAASDIIEAFGMDITQIAGVAVKVQNSKASTE